MTKIFGELLILLLINLGFVGVLLLALVPLYIYKRAAFAVLKRNFVGYFSNPTGYVFLCLFVLLSSFAAFWPHEFFTANLANLDQLNLYLPGIMLVFIPAITMSIWSEERRQGTDELLLTLPAGDFDIVIGKYLAAAAIFTASLLFSQISNFTVLISLAMGDVDLGLFLTTYFGYWLIGLAMISIGMVASFLTKNLTIGFILGVIFNMPLVFMKWADVLPSQIDLPYFKGFDLARIVSNWSISAQFDSFGRGVVSLSAIVYFFMFVVVGLYLSMVLISARHWYGGRDGHSLLGHFLIRSASLVVIALALAAFFTGHDRVRVDMSSGKISSLSPDTKQLLAELEPEHQIYVDAFISEEVPEDYIKTRLDLLSKLKEFEARSGQKIVVNIHNNLTTFSEDAALAEEQYGIRPERIRVRSRGTLNEEEIILGAAFRCGLQKVVVPFFDYGIPVEYELIRSINTVAKNERKTIGIVRTDAQLFGGFSFAGGQPRQIPRKAIVDELEKQYDVEEIDMTQPFEEGKCDLLLVVQPSSMPPEAMGNLVNAIKSGVPTAVFEDPVPSFMPEVPGTGVPKQAPGGGMMGMGGGRPMPKADIRQLWDLLGIDSPGSVGREGLFQPDVVWQRYNPYPKLQVGGLPDEWIFVREEPGEEEGLIDPDNVITSGLDEILFPFPAALEESPTSELEFTPLIRTRNMSGTIGYEQLVQNQRDPAALHALRRRQEEKITLAAHIKSETDEAASKEAEPKKSDAKSSDKGDDTPSPPESDARINVVYVGDIDLMQSAFLRLRARPDESQEIKWKFENITFILNIIDVLSNDTEYIEIRKRKPQYTTLKVVEARVEEAREREFSKRVEFQNKYEKALEEAQAENDKTIEELKQVVSDLQERQSEGEEVNPVELQEKMQRLGDQQNVLAKRFEIKRKRLVRDRDRDIKRIQRDIDLEIQKTQFTYKMLAVAIPWIPPFLVGLVVFVRRRLREREGIEKSRLK